MSDHFTSATSLAEIIPLDTGDQFVHLGFSRALVAGDQETIHYVVSDNAAAIWYCDHIHYGLMTARHDQPSCQVYLRISLEQRSKRTRLAWKGMHSADAVLVAAADAMADATLKLMTSDQPQLQLQDQSLDRP